MATTTAAKCVIACTHKYRHIEVHQWKDDSGYGSWNRIDIYHCIHCCNLRTMTLKKEGECSVGLRSFNKPEWYTL